MNRKTGRTVVITVVAVLLLLIAGAVAYMYAGLYNVAATAGHTGLTRWALNTTQVRSVAVRADDVPDPPPADSGMLAHGFEHFRAMCVVCHGAPGVERGEFGQGITPTPPALSDRAAGFTPKELFWITKHGIKLAGMPAFGVTHSDEELWSIVSFVERLPEMSAEEYQGWVDRYQAAAADGAQGGGHTDPPGTPPHSH